MSLVHPLHVTHWFPTVFRQHVITLVPLCIRCRSFMHIILMLVQSLSRSVISRSYKRVQSFNVQGTTSLACCINVSRITVIVMGVLVCILLHWVLVSKMGVKQIYWGAQTIAGRVDLLVIRELNYTRYNMDSQAASWRMLFSHVPWRLPVHPCVFSHHMNSRIPYLLMKYAPPRVKQEVLLPIQTLLKKDTTGAFLMVVKKDLLIAMWI